MGCFYHLLSLSLPGFLMSGLSMMLMLLFVNIFIGSSLVMQVHLLFLPLPALPFLTSFPVPVPSPPTTHSNALIGCLLEYFTNFTHTHTHTPQFELYFGLLLFCGFVLFDTQLIVEKFNHGNDDFIWHSLDLFLDFVNIFRRLLVILASKVRVRCLLFTCFFVCICFLFVHRSRSTCTSRSV